MARLKDIVQFLNDYLKISQFADSGVNGLQVEGKKGIRKIVLGVDASQELFEKAKAKNADMILVHHGLFWKEEENVPVGIMAKRLKFLFKNEISLYAAHIPLDAHEKAGNNAQILKILGITAKGRLGLHEGAYLGYFGDFKGSRDIRQFLEEMKKRFGAGNRALLFGPDRVKRVGVVSGSGAKYIFEAEKLGMDTFITGSESHTVFHYAKEARINVIFAGHYETEKFGVIALGKVLKNRFKDLDLEFIHCPTGL